VDSQVKLRGFRIELGEIEAVVAEDPDVTQCAAVVREDTPGDQRLVAYYVGGEPSLESLRARAREKLPAYMVPSSFVPLDEIPLTPNGKVDRLALARLETSTRTAADATFVAPKNELERRISELWREVLRVERVATDTNFFDLGGHSRLLAEVHARLATELDRRLSMVELFQYPTVATLAAHLSSDGAAEGDARARTRRGRNLAAGRAAMRQRRRVRE
jgi:acyl carrier protein